VIRAVFDTVVVLRAGINPGSVYGRLLAQHARHYQLIVSAPLLAEYLDVLNRPELTRRFARLADLDATAIPQVLAATELVELSIVPAVARDPNDDMVLATAIAGRVDYLVSEDRDLLELRVYEGIQIVSAASFLTILERCQD
jgi:putative PIN family toxin of toxin-antitoxin system